MITKKMSNFNAELNREPDKGQIAMCNFVFKPVEEKDLPVLYSWFRLPHVEQWWPTPKDQEEFFASFLKRIRPDIKKAYLVIYNGVSIGYIQSYSIDRATNTWLPPLPGTGRIVGIDQFISDPAYLHKGFGALFIKEFIKTLNAQEKDSIVIVDPEPGNVPAIRCYEKVGFEKLGIYQAPWGPALVMMYQER